MRALKISKRAELLRLALKAAQSLPVRPGIPIAKVRNRLRYIEPIVPKPPAGTRVTPLDADGVRVVRIDVGEARADRCIVYLHGGGYVIGTERLFRDFTWRIGEAARASVLYVDYRLAPEHPFPAAVDDVDRVYRWLTRRIDPARIAFVGDSAGGGLALAALLKLRDEGQALPGAVAALSPWTDLALTGPSLTANAAADPTLDVERLPEIVNHYLAGTDARHPYASPLYGAASGLPPILFQVGSDEILRDDSVRMAEKLRAAGCEVEIEIWPRMPHGWHFYARVLPEARRAVERVGEFLRQRIA
jgi:epsilon-lactone hydrolase